MAGPRRVPARKVDEIMARELSERQQKILDFLRTYIGETGFPPSIREIGEDVGISSTHVVKYNLNVLDRKGYIKRSRGISRGIRLMGKGGGHDGKVIHVPLAGYVAAGAPIPAPGEGNSRLGLDGTIALTRDLVKEPKNILALEVQGNSLLDALVHDGDIVLMRRQLHAEQGELAVVWLREEEETTLKHFYLEGKEVRLEPAHPGMAPRYSPADNVEVVGVVVGVIRPLS
jgi:repressor LexA